MASAPGSPSDHSDPVAPTGVQEGPLFVNLAVVVVNKLLCFDTNKIDVMSGPYKQRLLLVCEDNDVTENERIARKIKIGVGDNGLRRLNASGLPDVEQKNPAKQWPLRHG